jgi:hypothetical protein
MSNTSETQNQKQPSRAENVNGGQPPRQGSGQNPQHGGSGDPSKSMHESETGNRGQSRPDQQTSRP